MRTLRCDFRHFNRAIATSRRLRLQAREQQAANEAYARIRRDRAATLDDITSTLQQLVRKKFL